MRTKHVRGNGKKIGQGVSLNRRKQIEGNEGEVEACLNKIVTQKTEIKTRIRFSECEYALLAWLQPQIQ